MFTFKRTLRTERSERFLAYDQGTEVAAIDMHYIGAIGSGTVILLETHEWNNESIEQLLTQFDDDQLPGVDIDHGNLTFTVVRGTIVGNYQPEIPPRQS
jgi:hypothetical protein